MLFMGEKGMPRKPRFYVPDVPVHVVQRGNNRNPIFFNTVDYQAYLDWLAEAAQRYECFIHAYVLMTNHVHISTPVMPVLAHCGKGVTKVVWCKMTSIY